MMLRRFAAVGSVSKKIQRLTRLAWLITLGLLLSGLALAAEQTTRIVSLLPAFTEIAYELGGEAQIVGVSNYCKFPPEAQKKPRVGGFLNPMTEKIVALRPNLVVVHRSQIDLQQKLAKLGIPTLAMATDTVEEIYAATFSGGQVLGLNEAASSVVARWKARLRELEDRYRSQPPVRALMVASRHPAALRDIYVIGPSSYHGELLRAVGGINVASCQGLGGTMSKEQILAADPEVILDCSVAEFSDRPDVRETHMSAWKELSSVSAVRQGRVWALEDPHLTIPGPYMIPTAETIATYLRRDGESRTPSRR